MTSEMKSARELKQYEPYTILAEAIINQARRDYEASSYWIKHPSPSRLTIKQKPMIQQMVARYLSCREFFLNSCNGMIGLDGESIIDALDKKYHIDHAEICDIIRYYENKYRFKRSFVERFKDYER